MSDDDARLDEVAAELSVHPPSSFVALRGTRAAEASGDLGRRIARLRKPTVAAWAVNLLVHDGQLREAVELSAALYEAQDDRDAAELARLGAQRRALVAALVRRAADLAAEGGTPLSAAMAEAVRQTVNAAIVDAAAAAAVLTGRLVTALDTAAVEGGHLADAVAGSLPTAVTPAPAPDDLAARRARKAVERAVREAERARAEADRAQSAAESRLGAAREKADRLRERVEELRAELARAEAAAAAADADVESRESAHGAAVEAGRRAARVLARAEAARDEQSHGG